MTTPTRAVDKDVDRRPVTALTEQAADLAIAAGTTALHLPTIKAEASRIAEAAVRERLTHKAFLAEILTAELDDREARRRLRRIHEAKFPRMKRLEDLDLRQLPGLPATTLAALSAGAWIDKGEPVVLLGDSGTGKTHLLIGLGVAAAEAGRRVRYVTTAALVNELVEAADAKQLSRVVGRYARLDLLLLDELGYVHLDPLGAELLFQIITEREEKASIACASNAPFSEWNKTFNRPSAGRRHRRPADVQRPHHPDRHRLLPAALQPRREEGSRHRLTQKHQRPRPHPV